MMQSLFVIAIVGVLFGLSYGQTQTPIPSICYKPSGVDCKWYGNCLQKRHPCPENNYAMRYASFFCEKFGVRYSSFSAIGKRWVDSTRKCLQRVLVPFLDKPISCQQLKTNAFDSHTCCYVADPKCVPASEKAVSICDIPFKDWLQAFWTIKEAFNIFGHNAEIGGSIKGVLQVLHGCTFGQLGDEIENNDQIPVSRDTIKRLLTKAKRGAIDEDDADMKALKKFMKK